MIFMLKHASSLTKAAQLKVAVEKLKAVFQEEEEVDRFTTVQNHSNVLEQLQPHSNDTFISELEMRRL